MRTVVRILKWVVGIGLVILLVVGGAGVFLYPKIKAAITERAGAGAGREVRVEPVSRGRIVRTVSAPGEIEPRRKVSISARVSAQISALPFEEGDVVQAGDLVVRLEDKEFIAALESAQASLKAEEARLEGSRASHVNAVAEWERQKSLFETADVSRSALDSAEAELRRMESNLKAAEHGIEVARARVVQAEENLRYTTIETPINGRVTRLNAEVGEIVVTGTMNNAGTVILEVADLSRMLMRAQVDESDVALVSPGQTARVFINAYPDETFEGTVERIALQLTRPPGNANPYYETEIELHLAEGRTILSGLTANVDIEIETVEGIMLAPSQAVVDLRVDELPPEVSTSSVADLNKTFARAVYVVRDGKARATLVKTGSSDLTKTAILEGVAEGDQIIVGPWTAINEIKHNDQVRLMEDALAAKPDEIQGPPAPDQAGQAAADSKQGGADSSKSSPPADAASGDSGASTAAADSTQAAS